MINNILKALVFCALVTSCTTKISGTKTVEQTDAPETTTDADSRVVKCAHADGMLEVNASIVAYPKAIIDELLAKDIKKPLSTEALSQLLKQGDGRIIASPSLITKSRYEARWEVKSSSTKASSPIVAAARPTDLGNTGVGIILNYTPDILGDGKTIIMEVLLAITAELEMIPNPSVDQVFINQYRLATRVTLQDGETSLIAGGMPNKENEVIYVLFTCNILNLEQSVSRNLWHERHGGTNGNSK